MHAQLEILKFTASHTLDLHFSAQNVNNFVNRQVYFTYVFLFSNKNKLPCGRMAQNQKLKEWFFFQFFLKRVIYFREEWLLIIKMPGF